MDGKGTHEILPIAEELLVTNDYRRVAFLQGRGIGMCMQVALIDKIIFQKKDMKVGREVSSGA